jgi:hypothetical protein
MAYLDIDMDDFRARYAASKLTREAELQQMNDLIQRLRELVDP